MDYSQIRGFNYQPSYGTTGIEQWQNFDAAIINEELGRGKKYFPKTNAIRLWLCRDSFLRGPARFSDNFETLLRIVAGYDMRAIPVLFNRWHDYALDWGGIYYDHFLPGVSWVQREDTVVPYLEEVVGRHADDPRVIAWDTCNEPFSFTCSQEEVPAHMVESELRWLEGLYVSCKALGPKAPVTVSIQPGHRLAGIRQVEPISDILSIHPYWTVNSPPHQKADYESLLDEYVRFSAEVKKPLLATETCWGSLDDGERGEIIRYTLAQLKKRGIGWTVHILHHSLIADAHRPEFGPVSLAGNMSFIEADGTLRPGHEAFNDF